MCSLIAYVLQNIERTANLLASAFWTDDAVDDDDPEAIAVVIAAVVVVAGIE